MTPKRHCYCPKCAFPFRASEWSHSWGHFIQVEGDDDAGRFEIIRSHAGRGRNEGTEALVVICPRCDAQHLRPVWEGDPLTGAEVKTQEELMNSDQSPMLRRNR